MQTIIENVARWLERQAKIKRTVRELEALNDRDLADIGINRCDIYRIAYERS